MITLETLSHIHRVSTNSIATSAARHPCTVQPSAERQLRDDEGEVEEGTEGSGGMIEGWRLSGGPWYGNEITVSREMGSPSLVFFL